MKVALAVRYRWILLCSNCHPLASKLFHISFLSKSNTSSGLVSFHGASSYAMARGICRNICTTPAEEQSSHRPTNTFRESSPMFRWQVQVVIWIWLVHKIGPVYCASHSERDSQKGNNRAILVSFSYCWPPQN